MDATVIICTYNRAQLLRQALESIRAMAVPARIRWEVVVVDNNSTDATEQLVRSLESAFPCPLRYVFEGRQGKSHALNTAIDQATGEYLLFTDDDITVDGDWLRATVDAFRDWDCRAIGGRIVAVWTRPKPAWYCDVPPYRLQAAIVQFDHGTVPGWTNEAPFGANMAFRRDIFDVYGSFNPALGPLGTVLRRGEDTDFCRRLLRAGEPILYLPAATVFHPVEEARTRKRYFTSWYFEYGRTAVRELSRDSWRDPARAGGGLLAIPPHLLRTLLAHLLRWGCATSQRRRFYFRLKTYETLGRFAALLERRGTLPLPRSTRSTSGR